MSEIERYKETICQLPPDKFFQFFNNNRREEDSWPEGEKEFETEIVAPVSAVCDFLDDTKDKVSLEIGYGGGRLIAAASKMFKRALGVDIHCRSPLVLDKLVSLGIKNFGLYEADGKTIPVSDEYVDFVYSYIVFQHLETMDVTMEYLKEIRRVLKKGGMAIIYFGRAYPKETETFVEKIEKPVNHTNIRLSEGYAVGVVTGLGLEVEEIVINKSGSQFALIIKK